MSNQTLNDFVDGKINAGMDSIITIKGGSAIEMIDNALKKVLENIADVNTTLDKRKIKLELIVQPIDETRTRIAYGINVPPPTLCGQEPIAAFADIKVEVGKKGVHAVEQKGQLQPALPNVVDMNGTR